MEANRLLALIFTSDKGVSFSYSPHIVDARVDMKNKHIEMPYFNDDVPLDCLDHLLVHECSHIIFSENNFMEQLQKLIQFNGEDNKKVVHSIFNVLEDSRIDKLIKEQYSGLGKIYKNSFEFLFRKQKVFIGPDGTVLDENNIDHQDFLTRFNLYSKSGYILDVKFNPAEDQLVDEIRSARTANDIYVLTKKIYDMLPREESSDGQGDKPQEGDNPEQDQENGESNPPDSKSGESSEDDQSEKDEDTSGEDSDGNSEGEDSEDGESDANQSDPEDEDDNESDEDDTSDSNENGSDEKSEDEESEDNQEETGSQSQESEDENDDESEEEESESDGDNVNHENGENSDSKIDFRDVDSFGEIDMEQLVSEDSKSNNIVDIDVTGFKPDNAGDIFKNVYGAHLAMDGSLIRKAKKFGASAASVFHSKMKATEYSRTTQATTGMLCPKKLWGSQFNEDIFLRKDIVKEGKNHGLCIFVDLSGSMSGIEMNELIVQLLNTMAFCETINIPYIVYGHNYGAYKNKTYTDSVHLNDGVNATVLISSSSTNADKHEFKKNLEYYYFNGNNIKFDSCTGMCSMLIQCAQDVRRFKTLNNIEILHTIVMTDGGDNAYPYYKPSGGNLFDEHTKMITLDGGRTRYIVPDKLYGTVKKDSVYAEFFGNYTYSYMTLIHFGHRIRGKKIGNCIGYVENDFGYKKEFYFNVNRSEEKDEIDKYKNDTLFIKIFASNIAECEF